MKIVWSREKIAAAILLAILYAILGIMIAYGPRSQQVTAGEAVLSYVEGPPDLPCYDYQISRAVPLDLRRPPHANPSITEAWCIQVDWKCSFGPSMTPSFAHMSNTFDVKKVRAGWQVTAKPLGLGSCLNYTDEGQ